MHYRYLLFDIDGTLIDFKKSFDKAAAAVLSHYGKEPTAEAIDAYFVQNDSMWFGLQLHRVDREEIRRSYHPLYEQYLLGAHKKMNELFHLPATPEELTALFKKELGANAVPNPHAVSVCKALSKDHVLCIATNGLLSLQPGKLWAFRDYFDEKNIFISERLHSIKPEKAYFDAIIKELGCDASECLMIGDSIPNDIAGANAAHIASCYYCPDKTGQKGNPYDIVETTAKPSYVIADFRELPDIVS